MTYDYGRSMISKSTGLTGIEATHIANKLKEINVDPQTIDWEGAMSDAVDSSDRYNAVQRYLFNYYGVNVRSTTSSDQENMFNQQGLNYQTSTKQGVKDALRSYFNSSSKQEKAEIKDVLLNDNQMQFVLLTALYDGEEMPLAKRFLNEAMGGSVIPTQQMVQHVPVIPETVVIDENHKEPVIRKTWAEQLAETQTAQSIKKALPGVERGIERNLKAISAQLKSSISPKKERIDNLKGSIQQLKAKNEPLRLQLEYQRLLHQRQQLQQLKKMHSMQAGPNPMNMMFAKMVGIPTQQPQMPVMQQALVKPGHYIEYQPKLPPGYRWKKAPTPKMPKMPKRKR